MYKPTKEYINTFLCKRFGRSRGHFFDVSMIIARAHGMTVGLLKKKKINPPPKKKTKKVKYKKIKTNKQKKKTHTPLKNCYVHNSERFDFLKRENK